MWQKYLIKLTILLALYEVQSQEIKAWVTPEFPFDGWNVSLHCEIDENPNSIVTWRRNGKKLIGDRYKIIKPSELIILKVKYIKDSGEYTCHYLGSQNGFGVDIVENVSFTVQANLEMYFGEHFKSSVQSIAGQSVSWPCEVIADPKLDVVIDWYTDCKKIDGNYDPRFKKTEENSLEIENLKISDSGQYFCFANADNFIRAKPVFLTVRDVPNPPEITNAYCIKEMALISFESFGDNNSPILSYDVLYNSSHFPLEMIAIEKAEVITEQILLTLDPGANYTFQLIARNEIGISKPSNFSEVCIVDPDQPSENPNNVRGEGTTPNNLVIYWNKMPENRHFGPGLRYLIQWKQDFPNANWTKTVIYHWQPNNLTIQNQPTFVRYRIKIQAANDLGKSKKEAEEVIGYSGEGTPTKAPTNLKRTALPTLGSVLLQWNPVSVESLIGHFNRYSIQLSYFLNNVNHTREFNVTENVGEYKITRLHPMLTYYFRIFVHNTQHVGPPSEVINIQLSDGIPSPVQQFQAFPLGSSAFLLQWSPPKYFTKLSKYKIKWNINNSPEHANFDSGVNQTKISGFNPNTKYKLCIVASSNSIEGVTECIEVETNSNKSTKPDAPDFKWEFFSSENEYTKIKITWLPNIKGKPGVNFFVKYRAKGAMEWCKTDEIVDKDFIIIDEFLKNTTYEVITVTNDGPFNTESSIKEVKREKVGMDPDTGPSNGFDVKNLIFAILGTIVAVVFIIAALLYTLRNQNVLDFIFKRQMPTHEENFPFENFIEGNLDGINPALAIDYINTTMSLEADLLPYDQKYEFPREKLKLCKQLDAGAFGIVFKAIAEGIVADGVDTVVAVKTTKKMASHEVMQALVLELKIMIYLGRHLNVVNLLGAVTKNITKRELMVIVEYCPYGNLQSFLFKNRENFIDQIDRDTDTINSNITAPNNQSTRSVTTSDLLCWSFQIARGMDYLASRKVLHGDLAARNILLCDENVVKICDFGLARSMYKTGNYHISTERALPFKWLAIESISDQVFSTYSDVWSFGILLWELFSLGAMPYPGMNAGLELFEKLKEGYRMDKPEYATQEIFDIMMSCWRLKSEFRPLFKQLQEKISKMFDKGVFKHYKNLNEEYLLATPNQSDCSEIDFTAVIGFPDTQSPSIPK